MIITIIAITTSPPKMINNQPPTTKKVPLQDASFSSFSAKPPVVMQRTFVLPHAVTHLEATVTAQGIATKDLLATFESGQVCNV